MVSFGLAAMGPNAGHARGERKCKQIGKRKQIGERIGR